MLYNNIWKVSWQKENIDYNLLINDYKNGIHNRLILQEIKKNEFNENIYPDVNDTVFITCENKRILKCYILVTNIVGIFEDKYTLKKRNETTTYNLLKIQQIYTDCILMKTSNKIWEQN